MCFQIATRYKGYIYSMQNFKFIEHLVQILTWRREGLPPINLTNVKNHEKRVNKGFKICIEKGGIKNAQNFFWWSPFQTLLEGSVKILNTQAGDQNCVPLICYLQTRLIIFFVFISFWFLG